MRRSMVIRDRHRTSHRKDPAKVRESVQVAAPASATVTETALDQAARETRAPASDRTVAAEMEPVPAGAGRGFFTLHLKSINAHGYCPNPNRNTARKRDVIRSPAGFCCAQSLQAAERCGKHPQSPCIGLPQLKKHIPQSTRASYGRR